VNKIKTPEDASEILIKDTKEFNVNNIEYSEGTPEEQIQLAAELGDVETNLSGNWKDMATIKQNLWNKLHGVSSSLKKNIGG
jgi:hypothetical protein